MSESMVERVARSLFLDRFPDCESYWPNEVHICELGSAADYRGYARAAIEAMREPTKEMLAAEGVQNNCYMCGGHVEGWQLMIDAALSSPDS